jgi:hypothetical protein
MLLQLVITILLPLVVALVTKADTDRNVKALLLLGLNAVSNVLAELADALTNQTVFDLPVVLIGTVGTFIIGVAMHYGLWGPTTVSARLQAVGSNGRHEAE